MEKQILELIANDRIEIPLSSLYQKIKRTKANEAKTIANELEGTFNNRFDGERVFAYIAEEDRERARSSKEAVEEFSQSYPKYGKILQGMIAQKRVEKEKHLYFGVNAGSRINSENYIEVIQSTGLSRKKATDLYPILLEISRKLADARKEDRSIIVG